MLSEHAAAMEVDRMELTDLKDSALESEANRFLPGERQIDLHAWTDRQPLCC